MGQAGYGLLAGLGQGLTGAFQRKQTLQDIFDQEKREREDRKRKMIEQLMGNMAVETMRYKMEEPGRQKEWGFKEAELAESRRRNKALEALQGRGYDIESELGLKKIGVERESLDIDKMYKSGLLASNQMADYANLLRAYGTNSYKPKDIMSSAITIYNSELNRLAKRVDPNTLASMPASEAEKEAIWKASLDKVKSAGAGMGGADTMPNIPGLLGNLPGWGAFSDQPVGDTRTQPSPGDGEKQRPITADQALAVLTSSILKKKVVTDEERQRAKELKAELAPLVRVKDKEAIEKTRQLNKIIAIPKTPEQKRVEAIDKKIAGLLKKQGELSLSIARGRGDPNDIRLAKIEAEIIRLENTKRRFLAGEAKKPKTATKAVPPPSEFMPTNPNLL